MPFDRAQIQHLATLASLSLTDAEMDSMGSELEAIVRYVDELAAVETTNVPPTAQVKLGETAWREDVAVDGLSHEDALQAAPHAERDGFAVPGFVEN
jgi:aspartyl-tRNA(Asn)/glutamyl-tRNA(Gln) amidotransferase subunit C